MDIFDHPTVERLVAGERVQVQELRDALVEFWEENGTLSICADCSKAWGTSVTGCCGTCKWHAMGKGCTRRNIACLTYTCTSLMDRLGELGLRERYEDFRKLLWWTLQGRDAYYNSSRLPDDAELFIVDSGHGTPGGVEIATNVMGNQARTCPHLSWDQYLEKLSKTDSFLPSTMYHGVKQRFPDSRVRERS